MGLTDVIGFRESLDSRIGQKDPHPPLPPIQMTQPTRQQPHWARIQPNVQVSMMGILTEGSVVKYCGLEMATVLSNLKKIKANPLRDKDNVLSYLVRQSNAI